jgi:hypothetical protein
VAKVSEVVERQDVFERRSSFATATGDNDDAPAEEQPAAEAAAKSTGIMATLYCTVSHVSDANDDDLRRRRGHVVPITTRRPAASPLLFAGCGHVNMHCAGGGTPRCSAPGAVWARKT